MRLNFKVYKGVNGLIGPNGAGKTTTIKLILGLIKVKHRTRLKCLGSTAGASHKLVRCRKVGVLYEKLSLLRAPVRVLNT